jgi:hypothetical protein
MKSSELLQLTNLDGFRLSVGYSLEVRYGLMGGFFSAIISANEKPFVCLLRNEIAKAITLLPEKSNSKIAEALYLVNEKEKIAFHCATINNLYLWGMGKDSVSALIVDKGDLNGMIPGDLKWV